MKRQVKFRAWAIESELMIMPDYDGDEYSLNLYNNEVKLSYMDEIHYEGGGEIHTKYEWVDVDSVIMEFTGLTDDNGNDIYEGDILQPKKYTHSYLMRGVVIFDSGAFYLQGKKFVAKNLATSLKFGKDAGNHLVVIGNIYENREFLPCHVCGKPNSECKCDEPF